MKNSVFLEKTKEIRQEKENLKNEIEKMNQNFDIEKKKLAEDQILLKENSLKVQEELQLQISNKEKENRSLQLDIEISKKKYNELLDISKRIKEEVLKLTSEIDQSAAERDKANKLLQVKKSEKVIHTFLVSRAKNGPNSKRER